MHTYLGHKESSVANPHHPRITAQLRSVIKPPTPLSSTQTSHAKCMRIFLLFLPSSHPNGKQTTYPTQDRIFCSNKWHPEDRQNFTPYPYKIHCKSIILSRITTFLMLAQLSRLGREEAGWKVYYQQLDASTQKWSMVLPLTMDWSKEITGSCRFSRERGSTMPP